MPNNSVDDSYSEADGPIWTWNSALNALEGVECGDEDLAELAQGDDRDIKALKLSDTRITDDGLRHLRQLPRLQRLYLASTNITGAGLKHLVGLTKLEQLDLSCNAAIEDSDLASIAMLRRLIVLELVATNISDAGIARLQPLQNLRSLRLSASAVTDAAVKTLVGFPNLQRLDLGGNSVTDAGVAELCQLRKLDVLDLGGNEITDASLIHIPKLESLTFLVLSYMRQITDAGLKFLHAMPNLRHIDLRGTSVTLSGVESLRATLSDGIRIEFDSPRLFSPSAKPDQTDFTSENEVPF